MAQMGRNLTGRLQRDSRLRPTQPWGGHGQFLTYDLARLIHDHHQFAIMVAERQAVPAFVIACPSLNTAADGAALHLPEKILYGEFHRARSHRRIYFRHTVGPANHRHFKASAMILP
jgi:hypothetical protein